MSNYANPAAAYVWLDGDAFRAPAGTDMPADLFADKVSEPWLAYGGVEAGFEETNEQTVNKLNVFNKRNSAYKVGREPLVTGMKFRAVDNSKATLLTRLQGGTVDTDGKYPIIKKGVGEEFALFVRLDDGTDHTAWYSPRVTLSGPATRAAIDGKSLDGWEFDITALEPFVEIIPKLPEGFTQGGETPNAPAHSEPGSGADPKPGYDPKPGV